MPQKKKKAKKLRKLGLPKDTNEALSPTPRPNPASFPTYHPKKRSRVNVNLGRLLICAGIGLVLSIFLAYEGTVRSLVFLECYHYCLALLAILVIAVAFCRYILPPTSSRGELERTMESRPYGDYIPSFKE